MSSFSLDPCCTVGEVRREGDTLLYRKGDGACLLDSPISSANTCNFTSSQQCFRGIASKVFSPRHLSQFLESQRSLPADTLHTGLQSQALCCHGRVPLDSLADFQCVMDTPVPRPLLADFSVYNSSSHQIFKGTSACKLPCYPDRSV